jgi:hypothetical protein
MALSFLFSLPIFLTVAFGLAWPLAVRLPLAAAEKIVASAVLSLLGAFAWAWLVYTGALPVGALWALPALGVIGLGAGARPLADAWRDTDARAVIVGQAIVTAWCVGWLATIASYTGGGWAGDWFEHWERARFFLERLPRDQKFLGHDALTARPPLANVLSAAWLALTRADFAHYQFFSTLFASLVFLPAALLARRFGREAQAIAVCAALFLANPLLVQNATFAWTKLPAALFVLAGLYFFLRAQERGAPPAVAGLCGASLGAGLLAHYSAGPYVVMLAGGWVALGWARRLERDWQRATLLAAGAGAAVLALWFVWAFAVYGWRETFFSNSSVTDAETYPGNQLIKIGLNLRDTLVPHFLRPHDGALIVQASRWGRSSDWFFQGYQLNLPLACGSVAWLAILRELFRVRRAAGDRDRYFWGAFIAGVIGLGVATHGARDTWGLAHICLQALVLLGLAFLAGRWSTLGRGWRIAVAGGAAFDLAAGIVLHAGVQSYAFDQWFVAGGVSDATLRSYTKPAFMNLAAKIHHRLEFFSDALRLPWSLLLPALALILLIALGRVRGARRRGS